MSESVSDVAPLLTRRRLLGLGVAGMAAVAGAAHANPGWLEIVNADIPRLSVALPRFRADPADAGLARDITQIVAANLGRSALLAIIDTADTPEITDTDSPPRFADWRAINAEGLVIGRVARERDGSLRTEFRLWEVFGGQQLAGHRYASPPDDWRRVANAISNAVYQQLTGAKGHFDD